MKTTVVRHTLIKAQHYMKIQRRKTCIGQKGSLSLMPSHSHEAVWN